MIKKYFWHSIYKQAGNSIEVKILMEVIKVLM